MYINYWMKITVDVWKMHTVNGRFCLLYRTTILLTVYFLLNLFCLFNSLVYAFVICCSSPFNLCVLFLFLDIIVNLSFSLLIIYFITSLWFCLIWFLEFYFTLTLNQMLFLVLSELLLFFLNVLSMVTLLHLIYFFM